MKELKGYKKFEELSNWTVIEGHCLVRYKKGTDVNDIKNRVAFIEKTPRVRCDRISHECSDGIGCTKDYNKKYWIEGFAGDSYSKEYGEDRKNCEWCDVLLIAFGWE